MPREEVALKLHYERAGHGKTVILLHAGIADSRMWDREFRLYAAEFDVVRYDQRGFGQTPIEAGQLHVVDDLLGLMDDLGIAAAALVGVSMGARVALGAAAVAPERITRVVAAAVVVPNQSPPSEQLQSFWAAERSALEQGDLDAATEVNLKTWVDGATPERRALDPAVRDAVGLMQRRAFEQWLPVDDEVEEIELDPPLEQRLEDIATPVLLIDPARDLPDVHASCRGLAARLPDATLVTIEDAAHLVNLDAPEAFDRAVLGFLRA